MPLIATMSPTAQKDIPSVKDICSLLGYWPGSERPRNRLTDSTQSWRRKCIAADPSAENDLRVWRTPRAQCILDTMTMTYLDEGGFGVKNWPQKGYPELSSIPEYPKDQAR